jgi:DNA-binding MarR family transcriptional regulator
MVGVRLIRWVLDDAPQDLSLLDLLTLLALAEWARDTTGECWPSRAAIGRRLRRSESTVDRALRSLTGRGLVQIVKPAAPGRTPIYLLNVRHQVTHVQEATCVISEPNVRHFPGQRASSGDAQNPQEPSVEPSYPRARADEVAAVIKALRDRTGKTIDEHHATLVIKHLLDGRDGVRDRIRYLTGAITKDPDPGRFLPTGTPPQYQPEENW